MKPHYVSSPLAAWGLVSTNNVNFILFNFVTWWCSGFDNYCTKNKVFHWGFLQYIYGHIHKNLGIWSHFLKKSLIENFIFCEWIITLIFLNHCHKTIHRLRHCHFHFDHNWFQIFLQTVRYIDVDSFPHISRLFCERSRYLNFVMAWIWVVLRLPKFTWLTEKIGKKLKKGFR